MKMKENKIGIDFDTAIEFEEFRRELFRVLAFLDLLDAKPGNNESVPNTPYLSDMYCTIRDY